MEYIEYTVNGHVATLTLARPAKLNAVSPEMTDEIRSTVEKINTDNNVRAIILTGQGKAFCAGSDIKELDDYPTPWAFRDRPDYCDAIRSIKKPVIAAINGYAFGGGLEMSMSCDIRIASDNAKFGAPEITLGWIGGGGMCAFLTHSIGPSNAALMVYTGEPIDSATALSWGLVSYVVSPDELLAKAQAIAATIASRAPVAAQTGKLNLRAAHSMTLENSIQYERDLQTIAFATDDAAEGIRAFKEKRPAVFTGR
jgi:enoyl-CoA hydratase/carnithine racemase